jgi:hypothetical protein
MKRCEVDQAVYYSQEGKEQIISFDDLGSSMDLMNQVKGEQRRELVPDNRSVFSGSVTVSSMSSPFLRFESKANARKTADKPYREYVGYCPRNRRQAIKNAREGLGRSLI